LIFYPYSIIDLDSFLKQEEYRERPLILLPASASMHVRLFKRRSQPEIQATAIWKYGDLRHVLHQRPQKLKLPLDNITDCMLCRNFLTLIAKKKNCTITGYAGKKTKLINH